MKLALSIGGTPVPIPSVVAPLSGGSPLFFVGFFLDIFYVVGIGAAMAYILYGGWRWITSRGDPKEVRSARETIVYSLVGLAVIFTSIMLVNFVSTFFGINLLGMGN